MKEKKLKDPLYGYISIPSDFINDIIDSAVFQRLRRVTQTSYAPLYASAVHNRFVHSLGVYNLGGIACNTLTNEINAKIDNGDFDIGKETFDEIRHTFLLACLLHDVGHAPFSHTGEEFYLGPNREYQNLNELLIKTVGSEDFSKDVPNDKSSAAAPHEIMSAIVGLREYSNYFEKCETREFFARCITGYKYSCISIDNSIKNCFIQLLNSKVIDVDKLDYLIRDAYITGYNTVKIDYLRLLNSITIVEQTSESGEKTYDIAYYKGAISVIENVVYAHDSERKWIQNHPVILYECYLLRHIMKMLSEKLDSGENKLFSIDSITTTGSTLKDGEKICLISDDDIIHLAKRYYEENDFAKEYFDRRMRRHPVWKSEAEYKAFLLDFSSGGTIIDSLENAMNLTSDYLAKNSESWLINESLIQTLKKELDEIERSELDQRTKQTQEKDKKSILKVVECLMNYAKSVEYSGDYVLLKASQFNSGFLKPDFTNTKIVFSNRIEKKTDLFGKTVSSIAGIESERNNFFYIFYSRNEKNGESLDISNICKELIREFV